MLTQEANNFQTRIDSKRGLRKTQKKKQNESQGFDQCQTPRYAIDPLLEFIPKSWLIWESAAGQGNMVAGLLDSGYQVVATDILTGHNFFKYQPDRWDCQITNPPYSIKQEWIERSYFLGRPFALLLPVEFLGVGSGQRLFERFGLEVILLDKRVDFQTVNTEFSKSTSWFPTAWYTWGLGVGQQITFGRITKRPDHQLMMSMDTRPKATPLQLEF